MRNLFLFVLLVSFVACKKDTDAPTAALSETIDTTAQLLASGSFENGPYGTVTGRGKVFKNFNGSYSVVLDSFSTNNGPDLYVYLSKQAMPVDFIVGGKLKSTNGKQVYDLAEMPDLSQYKYICIHCKAFNHLFGFALLK